VNDSLRRAARTFIQAFITSFLTLMATGQFTTKIGDATVPNWSTLDTLLLSCGLSALIALVTWLYNWLEGWTGKDILIRK
jgi:hypothetical protein